MSIKIFGKVLIELLSKNKNLLFIIALLVINFFIRISFLSSNSIDLDEPFSLFYSQMSVGEIVRNLVTGNNPPFYEIMLHFWIKLVGMSPFAVRFPSMIFSIATILVVYKIGEKFFNMRTAVLSSLLLSLSVTHVYFSHEARVYSLFVLLTTYSFLLVLNILRNKVSVFNLISLSIAYILLAYSHYFGLLVIAFQLFSILIIKPSEPNARKRYFLVFSAFILFYIPFISIVISRFWMSAVYGTWITPVSNVHEFFYIFKNFSNEDCRNFLFIIILLWAAVSVYYSKKKQFRLFNTTIAYILVPVFFFISYSIYFDFPLVWKVTSMKLFAAFFAAIIFLFTAIEFFNSRKNESLVIVVVAWFVFPITLLFLISFFIPVFIVRYLVFIMPAFYILIAASVEKLFPDKHSFSIVSFALLLFMIATFTANPHNGRYSDKLAADVVAESDTETKIVICPNDYYLAFSYYYCFDCFQEYDNVFYRLQGENVFLMCDTNYLADVVSKNDKVIVIDAHSELSFPGNGVSAWFERRFANKKTIAYPDSSKVIVFDNAN